MIVYAGKRPQAIRSHPGASRYPLSLPGNDSDVNDRLCEEVPWGVRPPLTRGLAREQRAWGREIPNITAIYHIFSIFSLPQSPAATAR